MSITYNLKKLSAVLNPVFSTCQNKHAEGDEIPYYESPPEGYSVTGDVVDSLEIGQPFSLLYFERNGKKASGYYETSAVTDIKEPCGEITEFKTQNSSYILTKIDEQ